MTVPSLRAAVLAGVLAAVMLPSSAPAQTIPGCPNSEDALKSFQPFFVRIGRSYVAAVRAPVNRVENVSITIRPADAEPRTVVLTLDESGRARAIFASPRRGPTLGIVFDWDQDLGTTAACHGRDVYDVPVVSPGEKVGDPYGYRLQGTYRVRFRRGAPVRWRIRPHCDYFGCSATIRSSEGIEGRLRYGRRHGGYEISDRVVGLFNCRGTGSLATYTRRQVIVLGRFRGRDDVATRAGGPLRETFIPHTPGCPRYEKRSRITLRRVTNAGLPVRATSD